MSHFSRREFFKTAAGAIGAVAATSAYAAKRSATDWVELGNSGVKVTRLAFGTGTHGGRIQRELGQEQFTRLVRHAYDRGIRFFETAQSYKGMPEMLGVALKGIPRDSYRLMTKLSLHEGEDGVSAFDDQRRFLQSEYVDVILVHCVRTPDWMERSKRLRDSLSEAKQKKIALAHGASCHGLQPLPNACATHFLRPSKKKIALAHGASCHGLQPLQAFPKNNWLDVALLRVNHDGTRMDNMAGSDAATVKGDVPQVVSNIKQIRGDGTGVIGMKIMGEGQFQTPEQRDASIQYVMKLGTVDAVTIGYKSTAEIDEAIERINKHLNA
jgi:hypothetical protein